MTVAESIARMRVLLAELDEIQAEEDFIQAPPTRAEQREFDEIDRSLFGE